MDAEELKADISKILKQSKPSQAKFNKGRIELLETA